MIRCCSAPYKDALLASCHAELLAAVRSLLGQRFLGWRSDAASLSKCRLLRIDYARYIGDEEDALDIIV